MLWVGRSAAVAFTFSKTSYPELRETIMVRLRYGQHTRSIPHRGMPSPHTRRTSEGRTLLSFQTVS